MGLGERISPTSVSDLRVLFNVEPLSDARTLLADFFNILLCGVHDGLRQRSITSKQAVILLQAMWEVQVNRDVDQEKLAGEDGKGLHV